MRLTARLIHIFIAVRLNHRTEEKKTFRKLNEEAKTNVKLTIRIIIINARTIRFLCRFFFHFAHAIFISSIFAFKRSWRSRCQKIAGWNSRFSSSFFAHRKKNMIENAILMSNNCEWQATRYKFNTSHFVAIVCFNIAIIHLINQTAISISCTHTRGGHRSLAQCLRCVQPV